MFVMKVIIYTSIILLVAIKLFSWCMIPNIITKHVCDVVSGENNNR